MPRGIRNTTEASRVFVALKVEVTQEDLTLLTEWGQDVFRTPGGQASFLLKSMLENKRNGRSVIESKPQP